MSRPFVATLAAIIGLQTSALAMDRISQHAIVSAGGAVVSGNLKLDYSMGEPVVGTVSACNLTLHSGFQATLAGAPSGDHLFRNGFDSTAC